MNSEEYCKKSFMKKSRLIILLILLFFTNTYANAGTPLMWAGLFHLLFGNFIETFLLQKEELIYKTIYVFIIIVAANYASMFAGWILSSKLTELFGYDSFNPTKISYLWETIFLYVSLTIASFIVEYPFYYWVLNKKKYLHSFIITIKINSISAVVVFIYYLIYSDVLFQLA